MTTADEARARLIDAAARHWYETQQWSDGTIAATSWDRAGPQQPQIMDDMTRALDTFLAHPDELLTLLGMEQVGWFVNKPDIYGLTMNPGMPHPHPNDEPVYRRVRPEEPNK